MLPAWVVAGQARHEGDVLEARGGTGAPCTTRQLRLRLRNDDDEKSHDKIHDETAEQKKARQTMILDDIFAGSMASSREGSPSRSCTHWQVKQQQQKKGEPHKNQ